MPPHRKIQIIHVIKLVESDNDAPAALGCQSSDATFIFATSSRIECVVLNEEKIGRTVALRLMPRVVSVRPSALIAGVRKLHKLQVIVRNPVDGVMVNHSKHISNDRHPIRDAGIRMTRPVVEGNVVYPKIGTTGGVTLSRDGKGYTRSAAVVEGHAG